MNNTPRFKQHQSDEAVVANDATKHVPSSFLETVKRPLAEAENVVRSSRDALSGRAFTDSLLQKDKILAQKSHPTHLLQDTVELPNEEPLPLHANSLDAYPNPLKYPLACHRRGRTESFVCDPDDLLGTEAADYIEEILAEIRNTCTHPCGVPLGVNALSLSRNNEEMQPHTPCRIVVALARQPPQGNSGAEMTRELLKRWDVGTPECQDGILLLYIASEKRPFLYWNRGEDHHLNPRVYSALLPLMTRMFRTTTPEDALRRSLALIRLEQEGGVLPARRLPQLLVLLGVTLTSAALFTACLIAQITTIVKASAQRRDKSKKHKSQGR